MKQRIINSNKMEKLSVNRQVTLNFLKLIDEIIEKKLFNGFATERDLAAFIQLEQSYISKLKIDENRYVSLDMISRFVNLLGINSNNFFIKDELNKEKVLRDNFTFESARSGNTNNITNSKIGHFVQGAVVNGNNNTGNVNTTLKIINGLPAKDQKEIKNYLTTIKNQNKGMSSEIEALKKIIDKHKREIDKKEKELSDLSKKYVSLLEKKVSGKK